VVGEVVAWRERFPGWWLHRRISLTSGEHPEVVLGRIRVALSMEDGTWPRRCGDYYLAGEADRYRVRIRVTLARRRSGPTMFSGVVTAAGGGSRLRGSIREPALLLVLVALWAVGFLSAVGAAEVQLLTGPGGPVRWVSAVVLLGLVSGVVWWLGSSLRRGQAAKAFLENWLRAAVAGYPLDDPSRGEAAPADARHGGDDAASSGGAGAVGVWVVWRQDEYGNRFEVARHRDQDQACRQAEAMQSRGHKQLYSVSREP